MFKFRKTISIVVTVLMATAIGTTVMAADVSTENNEPAVVCVQTVTEQPLTGDDLLALAFEQSSTSVFSADAEQQLVATQILETRIYSDNSIEKDYSTTQFLLPAGVYATD